MRKDHAKKIALKHQHTNKYTQIEHIESETNRKFRIMTTVELMSQLLTILQIAQYINNNIKSKTEKD